MRRLLREDLDRLRGKHGGLGCRIARGRLCRDPIARVAAYDDARCRDARGRQRDRRHRGPFDERARVASLLGAAAAMLLLFLYPAWDRQLLASGAYMYTPSVPGDLDLITQLKAGTLVYYREGAAATVSVKRLPARLARDRRQDRRVEPQRHADAARVAHLPLLLHGNPKRVFIIGLGSGVTLGSALASSGRARRRRSKSRPRSSRPPATSRPRTTTPSRIPAAASSSATADRTCC